MIHRRLLALVLLLLPVLPATAEDEDHVAQKGNIKVTHAWSRATTAAEGVVFMDIESLGSGDRLTGAKSELAQAVEIHGAVLENGELTSRPLETIEISAGNEFVLEPEAAFLKLFGLKRPLVQGQEFEVELTFADAGALDVHVDVEAADAQQHSHAGHPH